MSLYPIAFWCLAVAAVASAIMVAWARNPLVSALFLAASFLAVSGLFVLLQAHFIGLIQVLIYAGAIVVLFIYVIMLLDLRPDRVKGKYNLLLQVLGAVIFSALLLVVMFSMIDLNRARFGLAGRYYDSVENLAWELLTVYVVPFELISVVLMIGIIGAVLMIKRIERKE